MQIKPKLKSNIKKFLNEKDIFFNTLQMTNSSVNFLFLNNIKDNIDSFKKVLDKYNINSEIYYEHKANKSTSIVKEMLNNNIKIDVSSVNELKHALVCGYSNDNIKATGIKNNELILLGLRHNIIFNIDSIEELNKIIQIKEKFKINSKTKIIIRINNFYNNDIKKVEKLSKFGIRQEDLIEVFNILKKVDNVFLLGYSFHIDTVEVKEKQNALLNLINIINLSFENDFNPYVIDIGGVYKINYIDSKESWDKYITYLKEDILKNNKSLRYNDYTYGLKIDNNTIRGNLNVYNYYNEINKGKYLDEILSFKVEVMQNRTIGEIISENMLTLAIEPGRSLLDNVGITVSKVIDIKTIGNDKLILLDINKRNLNNEEMLVDPILITREDKEETDNYYFIGGNLCLEEDMIMKRKVFFNKKVDIGDLVIFINTAGYIMDFSEAMSMIQKISKKIVVIENNGKYNLVLDDDYTELGDLR